MPAPEKICLLAAVDHLPIREIRPLRVSGNAAMRVTVERQREMLFFGKAQEQGHQPGITPTGEQ